MVTHPQGMGRIVFGKSHPDPQCMVYRNGPVPEALQAQCKPVYPAERAATPIEITGKASKTTMATAMATRYYHLGGAQEDCQLDSMALMARTAHLLQAWALGIAKVAH